MPILMHHDHAAVVIERHHGNRTKMLDDFPFGRPVARHGHLVHP
jgi:hypothetical protein